ncbi:MAG: hypothetical protein JW874_03230 [Spirochaetales bacterium]|nr:hypothetical protein [Spirochaetales bacterium]
MAHRILALSAAGDKRKFIREFIDYPKRLYRGDPYWLPWFDIDMKKILTGKHPFFLHSEGEFFLLYRNETVCGRVCVVRNTRYCSHHKREIAHFFFLDFPNSMEDCTLLMEAIVNWASARGARFVEGPMLFGGTYGSGVLVEGFASPPPMTMMPYNYPYYGQILERLGFRKWVDLYSARIDPAGFRLPQRISRVADLVRKRSGLNVLRFKRTRDLARLSQKLGDMYNSTAGIHPEVYLLSDGEIETLKKDLLTVARPELVKILADGSEPIGYLMAFPDLSPVLRRNMGKTGPVEIIRLLKGLRTDKKLLINGMGIIGKYQGRGGNALLYDELVKTVSESGFSEAELVQVAETTGLMLSDLSSLGAEICKTYRMYTVDV